MPGEDFEHWSPSSQVLAQLTRQQAWAPLWLLGLSSSHWPLSHQERCWICAEILRKETWHWPWPQDWGQSKDDWLEFLEDIFHSHGGKNFLSVITKLHTQRRGSLAPPPFLPLPKLATGAVGYLAKGHLQIVPYSHIHSMKRTICLSSGSVKVGMSEPTNQPLTPNTNFHQKSWSSVDKSAKQCFSKNIIPVWVSPH